MQGAKDLIESERGIYCVFVLLTATVLVVVGSITGQSWMDLAKWIGLTLVGSKTVTTAIDQVLKSKGSATDTPSASS
jgi:hypothetical protein